MAQARRRADANARSLRRELDWISTPEPEGCA